MGSPTAAGGVVQKAVMTDTFEALHIHVGGERFDQFGRRAVGGHSARVSGSRYLAALGVEIYKIAILARWASDVVLRYRCRR